MIWARRPVRMTAACWTCFTRPDEITIQDGLPGIWRYAARLPLIDPKTYRQPGRRRYALAALGAAWPRYRHDRAPLQERRAKPDRVLQGPHRHGRHYDLEATGQKCLGRDFLGQCRRFPGRLWRARRCEGLPLHAGTGAAGEDRPDYRLRSSGDGGAGPGL